ncbi:hypothetical protein ACFL56_01110 [Candidatus Margulisiibacteriota bacterium]
MNTKIIFNNKRDLSHFNNENYIIDTEKILESMPDSIIKQTGFIAINRSSFEEFIITLAEKMGCNINREEFRNLIMDAVPEFHNVLKNYSEYLEIHENDEQWILEVTHVIRAYTRIVIMQMRKHGNTPELSQELNKQIEKFQIIIAKKAKEKYTIESIEQLIQLELKEIYEMMRDINIINDQTENAQKMLQLLEYEIKNKYKRIPEISSLNDLTKVISIENIRDFSSLILKIINDTPYTVDTKTRTHELVKKEMKYIQEKNSALLDFIIDMYTPLDLINAIEKAPGRSTGVIENKILLQKYIQCCCEHINEHIDDIYIEITENAMVWNALEKIVRYHPSPENVKSLIKYSSFPDEIKNVLNWVVKNTKSRDSRRNITNGIIALQKYKKFTDYNIDWLIQSHRTTYSSVVDTIKGFKRSASKYDLLRETREYREFIDYVKKIQKENVWNSIFFIIKKIDTQTTSKEEKKQIVTAARKLCLALKNSGNYLIECNVNEIVREINNENNNGKKLSTYHIEKIAQIINDRTVDHIMEDMNVSESIKNTIKEEYQKEDSLFSKNDHLLHIAEYYSFQNELGRDSVKKYLVNTCLGKIPKYSMEHNKITFENKIKTKNVDKQIEQRLIDIRRMFFFNDEQRLYENEINELINEIQRKITSSEEITENDIEVWKRIVYNRSDVFPRELIKDIINEFRNIQELQKGYQFKNNESATITIEITSNPEDIIYAGETGQKTCQRISEETIYNISGEPIERAVRKNILLARAYEKDKNEITWNRSILEIVENSEKEKIVIIGRRYPNGAIDQQEFDLQLLQLIAQNQEYKYVVVVGDHNILPIRMPIRKRIKIGKLKPDIYRDVYKENTKYWAIDLELLREKWLSDPDYTPFAKHSLF